MRLALLLLLLLGWALPPSASPAERHLRRARVSLTGPLDGLEVETVGAGSARLELELAAGERRELVVACVPSPLSGEEPPLLKTRGDGAARFEGWIEEDRASEELLASKLSLGLRSRPLPPAPDPGGGGLPTAGLLVALAAFLFVVKLRARALPALGAGALGAGAVFALAVAPGADGASLRLIELEDRGPWALEVSVARSRLAVPAGWHGRLATRPALAPVDVALGDGGPGAVWTLEAGAADLVTFVPLHLGPLDLDRAGSNGLAALAEVWLRSTDGEWSRRGAWPLGAGLPGPKAGAGEPPGWLNPALPQGRTVLIARLLDPQALGDGGPARSATWLRWIGF